MLLEGSWKFSCTGGKWGDRTRGLKAERKCPQSKEAVFTVDFAFYSKLVCLLHALCIDQHNIPLPCQTSKHLLLLQSECPVIHLEIEHKWIADTKGIYCKSWACALNSCAAYCLSVSQWSLAQAMSNWNTAFLQCPTQPCSCFSQEMSIYFLHLDFIFEPS